MKNHPQTAEVGFLKTEPRKPSFRFLNFEVGSVRFLPVQCYASAVFATATCLSVCPSVTRRYCAKTVHFSHKVYGTVIGNHMQAIEWCHFR